MKQIEYKHVRHAWKLGAQLSQEKFDEDLMKMLAEHGREGWDLKGVIYEGGLTPALHAHFIFGRESAYHALHLTRPPRSSCNPRVSLTWVAELGR